MKLRVVPLLAVAWYAAGCQPSDEPSRRATGELPIDRPAPAIVGEIEGAQTPRDTSQPPPDAVGAVLAVDGDGLRLFLVPSGRSRPLPFGTSYEVVRTAVSSALGAGPAEESWNVECQLQLAGWAGGLTVWFVEERLIGWSLGSRGSGVTTASGIGVGSTRSEVEEAYSARVFPSTLGTEFSAGGLAGVLESSDSNARVTNLWAGQVCIAR